MSAVASKKPSIEFQSLPDALVGHALSFSPLKDIAISRRTCKYFNNYYPKTVDLNLKGLPGHIVFRVIAQYRKPSAIRSIDRGEMLWSDRDIVKLKGLPLKVLNLFGKEVTEVGMEALATLPIEKLFFSGMADPNKNLGLLTKMPLRELTLIVDSIWKTGFKHFENMSLEKLHIYSYGTGIFDLKEGIQSLLKLPLKDLKIVGGHMLNYKHIKPLKVLPLEKLLIGKAWTTVTQENLNELAKEIPTLKHVEICSNSLSLGTALVKP
jgi:hypothetical protein